MTVNFYEKIFKDYALACITVQSWKDAGLEVVFTNGCFDLFHRGHLEVLSEAADYGDKLIVGLNSDDSVRKIKGNSRPIVDQDSRAEILAAMAMVDMVIIFEEETPEMLIDVIIPDVLVKGGDYNKDNIVGAGTVLSHGGQVKVIPLLKGHSTTTIIKKLKSK